MRRFFANRLTQFRFVVGRGIRDTAHEMDAMGQRIQRNFIEFENYSKHRRVLNLFPYIPVLPESAFVAPNSSIIGRTSLGNNTTIGYSSVLRGDVGKINVGDRVAIGSNVVVHAASETIKVGFDTNIGHDVCLEDGCHVHGATLEDGCLIGFGTTILDGSVIGNNAEVAPNSLVISGTHVQSKQLWSGRPAKFIKNLSDEDIANNNAKIKDRLRISHIHKRYWDTDEYTRSGFMFEY